MCNVYFESLYPQKAKGNIEKKKKIKHYNSLIIYASLGVFGNTMSRVY